MFFYLSKVFWFVAQPTNALVLLALLGACLLFTRFARPARWMCLLAGVGLLVAGMSPLPYWLLRPLEDRFPKVAVSGDVAGIIVLGGAITTTRGMTSTNASAARMLDSAALALKHPAATLVFTGGDASLIEEEEETAEARTEAEAAGMFYRSLGIAPQRLILEDKARNTFENATFTKPIIKQKAGERWLLVTSAWHMPRSVGIFRKAGIEVIPYPVDFSTRGAPRDFRQFNRGFSHGLELTDAVVKEWIGLVAYRLAGYTDELLPGP